MKEKIIEYLRIINKSIQNLTDSVIKKDKSGEDDNIYNLHYYNDKLESLLVDQFERGKQIYVENFKDFNLSRWEEDLLNNIIENVKKKYNY